MTDTSRSTPSFPNSRKKEGNVSQTWVKGLKKTIDDIQVHLAVTVRSSLKDRQDALTKSWEFLFRNRDLLAKLSITLIVGQLIVVQAKESESTAYACDTRF